MRKLSFLFILILCVGCGSTSRSTLKKYREAVQNRQYKQALEIAKSENFYNDEESKLVKLLEVGTIHHRLKSYYQSLQFIDKAKDLSDKLFTKSISKAAKSYITSDSSNNYYGDIYERSLIRFYQSLNHFMLYQQGFYEAHKLTKKGEVTEVPIKELSKTELQSHRDAARAVLVEWASKLGEWQRIRSGKAVFKTDMLSKVYAAKVHESRKKRSELNIAKELYNQAERILYSNYSAYPSFNISSKKYNKNYEKFKKMSVKNIKKKYINPSIEAKSFNKFVKSSRKNQKGKNKRTIIFQNSMIAQKKPKKFFFPLAIASQFKSIVSGRVSPTDFAIRVLGLSGPNNEAAISFELPIISDKTNLKDFSIKVLKGEKKIAEKDLILVQPLNEIAAQASEENSFALKARVGTRLVAKHAAAIATAYASYKVSVERGTNETLAEFMAAGLYLAANKGIEKSEEADLRSWHSLPEAIFMQDLNLKPDKYTLQIFSKDQNQVIWSEEIDVSNQKLINILY